MSATYRNQHHRPGLPHYGPEFYATDARPEAHSGCLIYHRMPGVWDVVKDGVCVNQMAGPRGARQAAEDHAYTLSAA